MASISGASGSADRPIQIDEIFTLLESSELSVVEDMHRLILENMSSSKETWIINTLVDYYFTTRSVRAQEILAEVREPQDRALIEKIQDGLRNPDNRLQAIQLLLYLVHQQPPWTHRLVDRPVFSALLRCLRNEVDIPILMTGIMVVVVLLPVVPVTIESHLPEIFDVFSRSAGLLVKKPANSPDVFMLHLHVAEYTLFLRLYGMFPCSFLSFLRVNYAKKENLLVYNEIISPMLERVRLHPYLVTGSKDTEMSKTRWKRLEPQDIVVSCAKLSLDPIEGSWEELHKPWQEKLEAVSQLFPVVVDPTTLSFSPSLVIGLSTPPTSQRATPAASFHDVSTRTVSASPQIVTPTPEVTPREMPFSDELERSLPGANTRSTPNPPRGSLRSTPAGLNRSQGNSAFISPFSLRAPPSSQSASIEPSPMKLPALTESAAAQPGDFAAARSLQFDGPEAKGEGPPRHVEMRLEKDGGGVDTGQPAVHVESLPSVVRTLSIQDSDPLDQEVSQITEGEDRFDSSGSFGVSDGLGSSFPQQHKTAQSVIQFMKKVNRIRFNSLTYHASEPLIFPSDRHVRPGRARSCPPLHREPLVQDPHLTSSPNFSSSTATKLDTVSESAVSIHGKGDASFTSSKSQDSCRNNGGSQHGSSNSPSGQAKMCVCQCAGNKDGDLSPATREFATMFQNLLAPVQVAVCRQCHQLLVKATLEEQGEHPALPAPEGEGEALTKWPGPEVSLFSMLSPPELLDRHLTQGSGLHAKELAHIPLTSKGNVSWTHFGGVPPADEINILRGQILLLQNQVMYERHKRTNHAMRNRRLLRRIAHVTALEEQVQSLTEQLQMREKDVQNLQVSLKLLQDHNHHLQQAQDSDEYERLVDFKTTIQQNKDLVEGNAELKNLLLNQRSENDDLKKELQEVRAQLFETKKENEILKTQNIAVNKWKGQVLHLQKEVLLMGEAQLRLQNQLQQQTNNYQPSSLVSQPLVQALKGEVKELKKHQTQSILSLEAAQCRVIELDDILKTRDIAMSEVKNNFEHAKATHAAEIRAVEEKYKSMLRISQQLETQILKLTAENDCLSQKLKSLQMRASRRGSDRGDSPQAGGKTPPGSDSNPRSHRGDTGTSDDGAKLRHASTDSHTDERRDSGRGSMSHLHHSTASPVTKLPFPGGSVSRSSPVSSRDAASSAAQRRSLDSPHRKDSITASDQHADSLSVASEGGVVTSSHAMLYTDSEDNQSHSSHSNFTTDSGVFSKDQG
ncbi:hypothetical protein BaRGS_00030283 [Batillaria attramentaria]|uniref:Hamartin n=1 Tax=Batillaria attramentaria TaxID=370345 RepID=A0ABD0JTX4_9CAEN